METPKLLLPALRQFQHNDCSGFIKGFDYDETIKIFNLLLDCIDVGRNKVKKSTLLKALEIIEKI